MNTTFFQKEGTHLIRSCRHGPKVWETADGEIIKVFYPKRWFSSNTRKPYAKRFCDNAKNLARLHITAPIIKSSYYCDQSNTHYVLYNKLSGLDTYMLAVEKGESILNQVIAYISLLHEKGIFFRAIHLSNILHQNENQFALIDIADIKIQKNPLSLYHRYRNLKHLFLYADDKPLWEKKSILYWIEYYCDISRLSAWKRKALAFFIAN